MCLNCHTCDAPLFVALLSPIAVIKFVSALQLVQQHLVNVDAGLCVYLRLFNMQVGVLKDGVVTGAGGAGGEMFENEQSALVTNREKAEKMWEYRSVH